MQYVDAVGRRRSAGFLRREDALAFEQREKRKKELTQRGLIAPDEDLLFQDDIAQWLRKREKKVAYSTFCQDESRIRNYWLKYFLDRPVIYISTKDIREKLDHIQFELKHAPADRNRHRALLHKYFQDAFMDGKVEVNPVSRIPLVREIKKRKTRIWKEPKDIQTYIDSAYEEGPQWGLLATLLLWGGPRIDEALAIQVGDVDFPRNVIWISRIFERASGQIKKRTKGEGEGGIHFCVITPPLRLALQERLLGAYSESSDFLIHDQGKMITYDRFKGVHKRVLKRAGVPPLTPHELRHTFASQAKAAGIPKGIVQDLLGHKSEHTTQRYLHSIIEPVVSIIARSNFGKINQSDKDRQNAAPGVHQMSGRAQDSGKVLQ